MNLTPAAAIALAQQASGLDDFGPDGWQDGLNRGLDAFARLPLTPAAREAAHARVIQDLSLRLQIVQWYKDYPETADQRIEGPIFVIGMPRTGTTATVAMLAMDDRFRFLRGWEGSQPMPPPVAGEEDRDPRAIAAREAARSYTKSNVHLFDPDGPEEDLVFLAGLDMHAYHGAFPMPDDYVAWWMSEDFASTYAFHERVLKLLQSRRSPHLWVLKSPPHLFKLDAIARQYPQARFVMTHRDPVKLINSVASLHHMLHLERCETAGLDKRSLGPKLLAFWAEGMRRALTARAAIGEERFIDVRNQDVVNEPLETFTRIYQFLGMELMPALRDQLAEYSSRNAPGAFGKHDYSLEEYGLSEGMIRDAFSDYLDRFPA